MGQQMVREQPAMHRAQVGIECPQCHFKQFIEIHFDGPIESSPAAQEIRNQLQAWIASRCPDHLGRFLDKSMN
jgi:hypothetical protein